MQVRSRAASEEGVEFLRGNDRQPSPIIFLLLCMPRVCVSVFDSVKWASAMEEASVASNSFMLLASLLFRASGRWRSCAPLRTLLVYIIIGFMPRQLFKSLHNHCVTAGTFIPEHNNSLPGLIRYSGDALCLFHITYVCYWAFSCAISTIAP